MTDKPAEIRSGPDSGVKGGDAAAELKRRGILFGCAAVAGVLAVMAMMSMRGGGKPAAPPVATTIRTTAQFEPSAAVVAKPAMPQGPLVQPAGGMPPPAPADQMLESARRAPVTAFAKTARAGGVDASGFPLEGQDEAEDKGAFEKRFTPPVLKGARAALIGDRRFIVAQGTAIPCVLETALQSDQPGFTSCVMTRDVLSDNGQVVLMEKGTQVVGEYRGGLEQGQARVHVLWSRAKTPTGVIVELGSAATDALGRAGMDGAIDNHWWERFGSALLLSVVSDASSIGAQQLQQSAGVQANGTAHAPNQAAAIAVEQSAKMKPTLHKNQGEMVSIFVARDLDFSGIYKLRLVGSGGASSYDGIERGRVYISGSDAEPLK